MPARPAHHPLATIPERGVHPHLPPRWIRRRRTQAPADGLVGSTDPRGNSGCPASPAHDVGTVDPAVPTGSAGPTWPDDERPGDSTASGGRLSVDLRSQDGSVATEYGLLAVVAATIVSVMLDWATSGGITSLLQSIMARVASLVGL